MPVKNYVVKEHKGRVYAPHGPEPLLKELQRLHDLGCWSIEFWEERHNKGQWHFHAKRTVARNG